MVSSSAGMVLVSSRQGTVPFSFSSSIYGRDRSRLRGPGRPRVSSQISSSLEQMGSLAEKTDVGCAGSNTCMLCIFDRVESSERREPCEQTPPHEQAMGKPIEHFLDQ